MPNIRETHFLRLRTKIKENPGIDSIKLASIVSLEPPCPTKKRVIKMLEELLIGEEIKIDKDHKIYPVNLRLFKTTTVQDS